MMSAERWKVKMKDADDLHARKRERESYRARLGNGEQSTLYVTVL